MNATEPLSRGAGAPPTGHASAPVLQAFWALRIGFTVAPIVAGFDKFSDLLTEWSKYLWPAVPAALGLTPEAFMHIVGPIEIAAGLLVGLRPRIGGWVVAAWLLGIIANLLLVGGYWDIALRDLGLAIGAFALARLAAVVGRA